MSKTKEKTNTHESLKQHAKAGATPSPRKRPFRRKLRLTIDFTLEALDDEPPIEDLTRAHVVEKF